MHYLLVAFSTFGPWFAFSRLKLPAQAYLFLSISAGTPDCQLRRDFGLILIVGRFFAGSQRGPSPNELPFKGLHCLNYGFLNLHLPRPACIALVE
jgi:hypothetical protein